MKLNLKKFALAAGVLGCAAGPLAGLAATRADAVPPAAHPGAVLAAAGSDTTYFAMGAIMKKYNAEGTVNTETPKDKTYNIPPQPIAPFPASFTVPADSNCPAKTYNAGNLAPNGSSAGISALNADAASAKPGCIDWARSSRGVKTTDPAVDEFYAYALDALGYLEFPGSRIPSKGLTQQNLIDIYTCNPATGAPYVGDWHTLNPAAPAGSIIKKYAPQTQSGSYSFWNSKVLNGATIDAGCNASHLSTFTEEHNATGVSAANKPNAIIPFSYAQWQSAAHHVIPDLRNGGVEWKINGLLPTTKTIVEVGGRFLGTRYVYNVANKAEPRYSDVLRFIGVDNKGPGFLCSNKAAGQISQFGEKPLAFAPTGGGVTVKSYCRKNPADL